MIIAIKPPRPSDAMNMKTAEDIKAFIEYRDIQHKELRGGVMMYDVKDQHKWLTESELLQHWIDHVYQPPRPTSLPSDWTKQCSCNPDDKIGETWCCNTCGKPTPRLSTELPSDLVLEITKLQEQWDENGVGLPYNIQLSRVNSCIDSLFKDQLAKIAEVEREMTEFRELARLISALNEEHEYFKSIAGHIKLARKLLTDTTP